MKRDRIQKRAAVAALIACASFAGVVNAQQADATQEKIRLMVTAVQARDSGDFKASKQALEELVKIAPKDEGVQKMLADVNKDIERQVKGEAPVLVSKEGAEKIAAQQAEEKKAAEAKTAAEAKAAEETKLAAEAKSAEEAKLAADAKAAEEAKAKAEAEAKAAEPTPAEKAVAEANRKQQISILASYDLIDEAYDAMDSGNWDVANEKLSLADQKVSSYEYSPISDEVRSELKRARATMAKERANIAMADRDLPAAKTFAAEYAASEENPVKGKSFVESVDKFEENPYNHRISDVNPDYSLRMKKVGVLLEKGRRQYLYGDYAGARSTFRQIETLDADNIQAKAYLRLVAEKLQDVGRLSYLATRESMLDEVNKGWVRPQVYSGANVGTDTGAKDSVVDAKLRNIVIPNVSFPEPGVPLAQAINTLSVLSVDYDKSTEGKKGVNIVLFDTGSETKNVVLTLRDLPLGQILDWVTQQAGYQYDIEKDTIVVRKANDSTVASMDTIDYPVTQAAVLRMIGLKAGGAAGGGDSGPFGGGGGSTGGGADEDSKGEAIKQFLIKAGVEFGPGASLAFADGKIWVTNSRRNLDKVRNILLRYSEIKQVEIEAKFMEVNQGDLKELGFNWSVYNTDANGAVVNTLFQTSNRALKDSAQSTNAGKTPITINDSINATTSEIYQSVPSLPATINIASSAVNSVNTVLGVIQGYNIDMEVRALEQKNGSDMLCAPKVTVISGSTASITVSQQMRYPENWGDMQSNVGTSSGTGTAGGAAGVTITPGTPQDFTTYDVGVTMEVTPNVEDDSSISLQLNPRVTEFEGFMEYGGVAVAISSGTTVTVPSGFIQPVFSVREVRTNVTVFDGATVVMGGLTREEVITVNDQVPILGDIPFVGRLFQSKGETRQKKNLLIFVTVNRISPGGSIAREQFQDMRSGSIFQNPIIVSPGGAVQRVLESDVPAEK